MKKLVAILLATLMVLTLMAGCGGKSDKEKLNTTLYVGCSVRSFSNPYMVTINEGCEMFCEYLDSIGQKYVFETMLNEGSSDTQINQISAFLAKSNGNAILFCDPNEAAVCGTIAEMVTDAGAYMCTTWNKPDDINVWDYDGWVAHHSPNDVDMGYQVAKAMFAEFETPNEGKIICIQGLLGNTTAVNRREGLQKALDEFKGVTLVADETANWSADTALEVTETLLAAHDDIAGIWCANDAMAMGVIKALEAKGLAGKVKVCGVNAINTVLDDIRKGNLTASVDCQGWQQGGYSLAICYDAWLGKINVAELDHDHRLFGTGYTMVDKSNVDEFEKEFYEEGVKMDFTKYWEEFRIGDYPV
ncbi:sugar ABC transporter substrate-binding protein [Feifania hominis]|uniref:Sugar ABC transporter substrate-binding protein n=1 Tax=Feifania hominis TaxID=2763660 RepID=A0A926DDL4_9FIRM|nr:sugar ABC transporter substrate-binding protein [Feifania hominis]MBC8535379.1 sugar ABC transporter substrate-binding protein [Feifania hominis]